jgi:hypothetical protein
MLTAHEPNVKCKLTDYRDFEQSRQQRLHFPAEAERYVYIFPPLSHLLNEYEGFMPSVCDSPSMKMTTSSPDANIMNEICIRHRDNITILP